MKTRIAPFTLIVLIVSLFFSGARPAQSASEFIEGPAVTDIDVLTVNISNEGPGYLIDQLYVQLGNVSFGDALVYLKDHSNGVITDAFYNQVINSPGSEEVFLMMLRDYRSPFHDSVEIATNGTVHARALPVKNLQYSPGWATALGQDGRFTLTSAQDPANYFHTGTDSYAGINYHYKCFAVAWQPYTNTLFLPLVTR